MFNKTRAITGFKRPFGLNQDYLGRFYITDMDLSNIFRLSADFKSISWLDPQGFWVTEKPIIDGHFIYQELSSSSLLNGPHAIDFDEANNFYVTTYYSPAIKCFNFAGLCYASICDSGSFALNGPASAFFTRDKQSLLVAEYGKDALLIYSKEGEFQGGLGALSTKSIAKKFVKDFNFVKSKLAGGFDRPHMFKEATYGNFYCADTWNNRIQCFNKDGEFISEFKHRKLKQPVAISFHEDKLIVCSWGSSQILLIENNKLKVIKTPNLSKPYDAQIYYPWLVIADSHNGRVLFLSCK